MSLALNKEDIPSAAQYIQDIISQVPIPRNEVHPASIVVCWENIFLRHSIISNPVNNSFNEWQSLGLSSMGHVFERADFRNSSERLYNIRITSRNFKLRD